MGFGDIGGFGGAGIFVARDGPHWFVGDNDFVDIFGADIEEPFVELAGNGRFGFAIFAFESSFADAENWCYAVANSGSDFFADVFIGFAEDVATFGMSDDGIIDETANLGDGGFASEGAKIAPIKVLGGEFELTTVYLQREWLQGNCGRGEDHLDVANGLNAIAEPLEIETGLAGRKVHLPVGDDISFSWTSHIVILT